MNEKWISKINGSSMVLGVMLIFIGILHQEQSLERGIVISFIGGGLFLGGYWGALKHIISGLYADDDISDTAER